VSDVFVRTQQSFSRLSDAHRSSLGEGQEPDRDNQGVPEKEEQVRVVMTSESCDDSEDCGNKGPGYCIVEMISTGNSVIEMGKNVKIGEVDPLKLLGKEIPSKAQPEL